MKIAITADLHSGFSSKTYRIHEKFFDEINNDGIDVLVVAGDIISHKQEQWKTILRLLRESFPGIPILCVRGNHDWWITEQDIRFKGIPHRMDDLDEYQKGLFKKYSIHYLEGNPYVEGDVAVYGWDGWYQKIPMSNDLSRMVEGYRGAELHNFMSSKAHKNFGKMLDGIDSSKKTVVVTHHNLIRQFVDEYPDMQMHGNLSHIDFLKDEVNYVIFAHTHRPLDLMLGKCHVINPGGEYDKPKHYLLEI